jgi:hypothetical protein
MTTTTNTSSGEETASPEVVDPGEPAREYTEEEDRVNRCLAGVRRRRI